MSNSARPTGKQLVALLTKAGWQEGGRRTHGVFFSKKYPNEAIPRSTVIPDKSGTLPEGTLGAILGVKQTGLGKDGLDALIKEFGLS